MSKIGEKMQRFVMSNPKRAIWFMTSRKPEFWEKKGEEKALKVFHQAAEEVLAYKDFLNKHGIKNHNKIKTIEDFKRYVPIQNKRNYLMRYSLEETSRGKVEDSFGIYISSGSTGNNIYMLTPHEDVKVFPFGIAAFLDYFWDIFSQQKKTLIINAMSLGLWTGGTMANIVFQSLASNNKNISFVAPGADIEVILKIIKKIGRRYEEIIVTSYPTFVKLMLAEGERKKINWGEFNLRLIISGEKTDYYLFNYLEEKTKRRDRKWTIWENYGGTEMSNPGITTPLSIEIFKLAKNNKSLSSDIFGETLPQALFQTNPIASFVEIGEKDNILITKGGKIPIVRYHPQDFGKIISWGEMMAILEKNKVDIKKHLKEKGWTKPNLRWPFIVIGGRTDYAISIFGAKISPQKIQHFFSKDTRINNFKISDRSEDKRGMGFFIFIELQPSITLKEQEERIMAFQYSKKILESLLKNHLDFKSAYSIKKESVIPRVKIFSYRQGPFIHDDKNFKPKTII